MEDAKEIPCATCQSWKKAQKKFSCDPNACKMLTAWLFENAAHLNEPKIHMQLAFPEPAKQYIV